MLEMILNKLQKETLKGGEIRMIMPAPGKLLNICLV